METTDVINDTDHCKISAKQQNHSSPRKYSTNSNSDSLKKCVRKGNMICLANTENISMLNNSPRSSKKSNAKIQVIKSSIAEPLQNSDEVLSGESLYKTYTFEQSANDEETDKCIAFWRSVMEKNLKPIKCTIIDNTKKRASPLVKDDTTVLDEKIKKVDAQKNVAVKIHEEYRKLWISALNEIKNKKLHEIALVGKARCKMCENLAMKEKHDPCAIDKEAQLREIKELNDWLPKSTGKCWPKKKDQKISQQELDNITNTKQENVDGEIRENKLDENRNEKQVVRDSKTYKYVDIIEEKKKSGAYSEWRRNSLKIPCACGYSTCDCNTNPAVISVEQNQSDAISQKNSKEKSSSSDRIAEDPDAATKNYCPPDQKLPDNQPKEQDTDLLESRLKKKVSIMSDGKRWKAARNVSLMLKCLCDSPSCDCFPSEVENSKHGPVDQTTTSRLSTTSTGLRSSVSISERVITHLVPTDSMEDEKQDSNAKVEAVAETSSLTEMHTEEHFSKSLTKVDSVEVIRRRLSSVDSSKVVSSGRLSH